MRPGSYSDLSIHGEMSGNKARLVAATELSTSFGGVELATNSRVGSEPGSDALVSALTLRRLGVKRQTRITLQEESYSTYTEMVELAKLLMAREAEDRVVVVTNAFQIPRARTMLRHIPQLAGPFEALRNGSPPYPGLDDVIRAWKSLTPRIRRVRFVAAEDVLPHRHALYGKLVKKVVESPEWKETRKRQRGSIRQIMDGTYFAPKNLPPTFVKQ